MYKTATEIRKVQRQSNIKLKHVCELKMEPKFELIQVGWRLGDSGRNRGGHTLPAACTNWLR